MANNFADRLVAKCYFVDVGQGSANVIVFADRRAIIIDCGSDDQGILEVGEKVLALLKGARVESIAAVIVSHNHRDHDKCIERLFRLFRQDDICIQDTKLCYLPDKNLAHKNKLAKVWKTVKEDSDIELKCASVVCEGGDKKLFPEDELVYPHPVGVSIHSVFPDCAGALVGISGDANLICAILELKCGSATIAFAGDAGVDAWTALLTRRGISQYQCDVLVVPHHGGKISDNSRFDPRSFFGPRLRAKVAIASVGSYNSHKHPNKDVIEALRDSGSTVYCTEITSGCMQKMSAMKYAVHELSFAGNGRSRLSPGATSIPCAGTVTAILSDSKVRIVSASRHKRGVELIRKDFRATPMCMC